MQRFVRLTSSLASPAEIQQKYMNKLLKAAKQRNMTVEELLADKRLEDKPLDNTALEIKPLDNTALENTDKPSIIENTDKPSIIENTDKPSIIENTANQDQLNSIVNVQKLAQLDSDNIVKIWNTYHSTKHCISGSLTRDFYSSMQTNSRLYPMVIQLI
jgi:hypothetical protein